MSEKSEKGLENKVGFDNVADGIDKLVAEAKDRVKGTNESTSAVTTATEIDGVIPFIMTPRKIINTQENYNKVFLSCAHLCQIGATSPRFAELRMVSEYGVEVKAGDLKGTCSQLGITPRKFARGIRNVIVKVAATYGIAGNLSNFFRKPKL